MRWFVCCYPIFLSDCASHGCLVVRLSRLGNTRGEKADIGSYFQLFRAWKPRQHGFLEINEKNRTVVGLAQTLISLYLLRWHRFYFDKTTGSEDQTVALPSPLGKA
jgi:hypothetical protein